MKTINEIDVDEVGGGLSIEGPFRPIDDFPGCTFPGGFPGGTPPYVPVPTDPYDISTV